VESRYAKSKYSKTKTHSVIFSTLEEYPDVLDIYQAAALAGVAIKTVSAWARKKYFVSFIRNNAYHIPKVSLVEYLGKWNNRQKSRTLTSDESFYARIFTDD